MVEDIVSVEEELYSICEEMEKLYKTNVESKVDDVDDEKVTYIGRRINKIKKIINNCELLY